MSGLPDDWVERATAAARATPVPPMPPGLAVAITEVVTAEVKSSRRRRIMRRSLLAGVPALVAVAALALWPTDGAARVLDEAAKQARAAKSVRKTERVSGPRVQNSVAVVHYTRDRSRTDRDIRDIQGHASSSTIWDNNIGLNVFLDHDDKTVTRSLVKVADLKRFAADHAAYLNPFPDYVRTDVHREPDGMIDGRPVKVTSLDKPAQPPPPNFPNATGIPAYKLYFSVDAQTGRLRRVASVSEGIEDCVRDYEKWDEEFDPKLFSFAVPDDYTLHDLREDGITSPKPLKLGKAAPPAEKPGK